MRLRIPDRAPIDYQFPRDNTIWADHRLRIRVTAEMIAWLEPETALDPAAGDGTVLAAAHAIRPIGLSVLGDVSDFNRQTLSYVAAGTETNVVTGTAEEVLRQVQPGVDVIVLTEILEHVEDPVALLRLALEKGNALVASSPLFGGVFTVDDNIEHLWQFDIAGYDEMLREAGWEPVAMVPLLFPTVYDFQLWAARRAA